jgi:tRNA(Ile)-lysidine synthase
VRPLLEVPRATTRAACEALGLVPHEDPANADPAYARARLRAAMGLLEETLGPGLPAALARTAGQLAEDADALDAFADALVARARVPGGYDAQVLGAAPDAVRRRALLAVARSAGAPAGALGSRHAAALDALVLRSTSGPGRRPGGPHGPVHLPGGVVATCVCGTLSLAAAGTG